MPMNKVRFVKESISWFADLPEYLASGGKKEDCLMVSGAPEMLEILAGGASEVTVWVNTNWFSGFQAVLCRKDYGDVRTPGSWAYYYTTIYENSPTYSGENPKDIRAISLMVGLCPVNSWVFGGIHPDTIFIKKA